MAPNRTLLIVGVIVRVIVGLLVAMGPACRRASPSRGGVDASAPAPAPPVAEVADPRAVAKLLDAYAADLAEVADRVEALKAALPTLRSKDDPRSPFVRVPSPALGTRLAARAEIVEVTVPFYGETKLVLRPLRGEKACDGAQSNVGDDLSRGQDTLVAMCPSFYDDDPRAVDVSLRRGQVHVVAVVRADGVCTSSRDERAAAVRSARAFVGAAEAPLLAYLDALPAACARDAGAQPDPGALPGLGRAAKVRAGCTRGDSGLRRSWVTLAGGPELEGDPREIGHYRPRAGCLFSVSGSKGGVRELHAYAALADGVEVDATFTWDAADASAPP